MKSIMFIAPPAAGKGTQAELMAHKYNIPHISTGDILREISKEDTEIGNYIYETLASGNLVKDEIIFKLIESRISKEDCQRGFIIDGFPRTYEQVLKYDEILEKANIKLGYVFVLDIDEKQLEKRITGRRICQNCNTVYNINEENKTPNIESICDICGGKLYQRKDDNIDSFQNRYKTYLEKTSSIIEHYEKKGIIYHLDGNKEINDIANEINNIIDRVGE